MSERIPYLYIATGQKGVGKSYFSFQQIMMNYVKPINQGGQGKPVLIFDTNDEYQDVEDIFFDITLKTVDKENPKKKILHTKAIAEHVTEFCTKSYKGEIRPHIRRIKPFKPNRDEMTPQEKRMTAEILLKYFKGGLLVLEDLNTYMLGAKTTDTIGGITTNRHRNLDILIHLQSLSALDPRLWQNVNVIRFHHQADPIQRIQQKIDNPELFYIAKEIVDHEWKRDQYFKVYIFPQENRMAGVTIEQFKEGCKNYLSNNPKIAKQHLQKLDLTSGKVVKNKGNLIETFIQERMYYIEPK